MGTLTALVLATPIFGFALTQPDVPALPSSIASTAVVAEVASFPAHAPEGALRLMDAEATMLAAESAMLADGPTLATSVSVGAPAGVDQQAYVASLRKRARLAKIHRTMGIATWGLTGVAVIAGTIQYRNLYGVPFSTKLEDTPCVQGNAAFSQDACYGTPWFHAITGFAAGAAYFSTLGLAIAMPDPDNASKGKSEYAKTLRTHKILRWVHLAGMVSQMVFGVIIANPGLTGLDRANDYDKLKMLSGFHLGMGYVTLGALSWAGTIMLL